MPVKLLLFPSGCGLGRMGAIRWGSGFPAFATESRDEFRGDRSRKPCRMISHELSSQYLDQWLFNLSSVTLIDRILAISDSE